MRTNIDIDDALMESAMRAGPYTTKREAVEAGLQMLARKAAYRDILSLRGQLQWSDETAPPYPPTASAGGALTAHSPAAQAYAAPPRAEAAPATGRRTTRATRRTGK